MAAETKKTSTKKSTMTKTATQKLKKPSSGNSKKEQNTQKKFTTKKTSSVELKTPKTTSKTSGVKPKNISSSSLKSDVEKISKMERKTKSTSSIKTPKVASKGIKSDVKASKMVSKGVKTTKNPNSSGKKKTTKSKASVPVKKKEKLTTLEVMESKIEGKEITEKEPLGKTFYLIFSIVFFAGAFFYINNIVYDNGDMLQSAIFAFAALFIVFVLMLFNIHRLVVGFFVLPFKRLIKQAKKEVGKEVFFTVGKNKIQTTLNRYKTILSLVLYFIIAGLLMYSTISNGLSTDLKILKIITNTIIIELVYAAIICSWQYLFNIIPSILDKSIDAKNGYILTLSATVMVVFVIFQIFDVVYLSEIMIFILIIGFVALLGVNLNMIVGEINIFQNLRGKHNKVITRIVFIIFFGFHIYVILYASVVAFSIYNWEHDSFNFSNPIYVQEVSTELYDNNNELVTEVYDQLGVIIDTVYDIEGNEITDFFDDEGNVITTVYDDNQNMIFDFYDDNGLFINMLHNADNEPVTNRFYHDGTLAYSYQVEKTHTWGDFLYWTVVTVSTIGYGDIHPSTEYNIAMAWGGFLGMYGLTFFALSISFVSNIAMEGVNTGRKDNNDDD